MHSEDENANAFFLPSDSEQIKREKTKARALRESQWWKNLRGTGLCYYCKQHFPPRELTMDHLIPLSRGGQSRKNNIVPCCKQCNNQKKYLLPFEMEN